MKCEIRKVSQVGCNREASIKRTTGAGRVIYLCAKCDANHGDVIGSKSCMPSLASRQSSSDTTYISEDLLY